MVITEEGYQYSGVGCQDCQRLTSGRCWRHATHVFITGTCWPPVQVWPATTKPKPEGR